MTKRRTVALLAVFLVLVFLFTACDGALLESIKQKYKDDSFQITTMSKGDVDKIAGLSEGFSAKKENNDSTLTVWVYLFADKESAEEYAKGISRKTYSCSLKGVFVCRIEHYSHDYSLFYEDHYLTESTETKEVISIFESFF